MRFLSHHDLMRFFERAIRRAGLPVKMSQGFNPRPRFSIAAALGVGVAAQQEILDIEFDQPVDPEVVRRRLAEASVPGIRIVSAERPVGRPAKVIAARYEVHLPPQISIPPDAVASLLARDEVPVERSIKDKQTRRINIRPFILDIQQSGQTIRMRLAISDSGAARPEEVVAALAAGEIDRNSLRIVRTALEVAPG